MRYKEYKDGRQISLLGMGNMRLPVLDGDNGRIDEEKAKAMIDRCMAEGINYYDTAYIYHGGTSEAFVGRALAEYPRDSFFVASKFNYQAEPDYRVQFARQLERLQMEYIDFYMLHGIQDRFAEDMLGCGCIAYFDLMKKEGKIRHLGFSFHGSAALLRQVLDLYPWDFVQLQINYYDWYYGDSRELYEIAAEAGIAVLVMEPVHGGMLARMTEQAEALLKAERPEDSIASWAMRWVLELPQVQVVLSGMSDDIQTKDNLATFSKVDPLTEKEHGLIREAARLQHDTVTIPCTACRYCAECPLELDIPYLLGVYDQAKIGGNWRLAVVNRLPEEKRPTACIGCGVCTAHCPQDIAIPEYMEKMQKILAEI